MKAILLTLLATCVGVHATTQEQLDKSFAAKPGGKLVVDVDFGSIEVTTNAANEVTVDVFRKVTRSSKEAEESFLKDSAVTFSQDDNIITVSSHAKTRLRGLFQGNQKSEAKYTISVPAAFGAQLRTAGGNVNVSDLTGDVKADTSGGGFRFARIHGALSAHTSGGGIRMTDCEGAQKVHTSGGGIEVTGGTGSLDGDTTGGSVSVRDFRGPTHVGSSGGGITLENVTGKVEGSTSGGSISASFSSPLTEDVNLGTSGGGVTLHVPEASAFNLDASTSGGSVKSELPVAGSGRPAQSHLKGPVNGGGKSVVLRTSGGSIHVKKS